MNDIIYIIYKHREGFLQGLSITCKICIVVWSVGLVTGTLVGFLLSRSGLLKFCIEAVSFVLSGMPVLVFLFWLHYPAQALLGISVDPFYTCVFMLSLINVINVSRIICKGIENVPNQYIEVARISGMSYGSIFKNIQIPLILRHVISSLLISQVSILHFSLFASLISVEELFRVSQRVISIEYKPVEIYTALGLFFLAVSLPINGIAVLFERKHNRRVDER